MSYFTIYPTLKLILKTASTLSLALILIPLSYATDTAYHSGDIEFILSDNDNANSITSNKHNEKPKQIFLGLHLGSKANITINGIIATIEIEQQFQNPSEYWAEARYTFPLPENAAVNHMEMTIGERVITASIQEKKAAKKLYEVAKTEGKKASLLQQHRPNIFTQQVSNIAPQETMTIRLRYSQHIDYADNIFSLRLPTTMTPRYTPKIEKTIEKIYFNEPKVHTTDSNWALANQTFLSTSATTLTNKNSNTPKTIINPIEININLKAGFPLASIDSDYHDISIAKSNSIHTITLSKQVVSMDRDFVIKWKPSLNNQPSAAFFKETMGKEHYGLVMLLPPALNYTYRKPIEKNMIFILDTSGSMGGESIKQAKSSLAFALNQLKQNDSFNIIEFNSDTRNFSPTPVIADSKNINRALRFVNKLEAGGGTEIKPALEAAFMQAQTMNTDKETITQIVFITDGSVSNEEELFRVIHKQLGQARLFTIGIGSAPNTFFMRKAAQFGAGNFTYIGNTNEVKHKMESLFKSILHPMVRDITITTDSGQALETHPSPMPDLYRGQAIIAAIKSTTDFNHITIAGDFEQRPWQHTINSPSNNQDSGVSTLWSRKKIESLQDKMRVSHNDENKETLKKQITQLALKNQLLSPYTSFVAVEKTISRNSNETLSTQTLANALPNGQRFQSISYPNTASSLWLNVFAGLLGLILIRFTGFLLPSNKG